MFQFRWVKYYVDKSSAGFFLGSKHFKAVFSRFFLRQQPFQGCLISAFSDVIQKLFGEKSVSLGVVVEEVWFEEGGMGMWRLVGRWLEGRGGGGCVGVEVFG